MPYLALSNIENYMTMFGAKYRLRTRAITVTFRCINPLYLIFPAVRRNSNETADALIHNEMDRPQTIIIITRSISYMINKYIFELSVLASRNKRLRETDYALIHFLNSFFPVNFNLCKKIFLSRYNQTIYFLNIKVSFTLCISFLFLRCGRYAISIVEMK